MSETQTSTSDITVSEAPAGPPLRLRDLRATESMASFFDEYTRGDLGLVSGFHDALTHTVTSPPASRSVFTREMIDNLRTRFSEGHPLRAPALERINTRRPNIPDPVSPTSTRVGRVLPRASDAYVPRNPVLNTDFDGDTLNTMSIRTGGLRISDAAGNRRFTINPEGSVLGPSVSSSIGTLSTASNFHLQTDSDLLEQKLVKFFKEKLTLNVSLSQLSAGLEVKVSLNVADSGEELLSAEDFVKLD